MNESGPKDDGRERFLGLATHWTMSNEDLPTYLENIRARAAAFDEIGVDRIAKRENWVLSRIESFKEKYAKLLETYPNDPAKRAERLDISLLSLESARRNLEDAHKELMKLRQQLYETEESIFKRAPALRDRGQ